jgi:chitinase
MTYDLVSGFSTVTGHHTPLYSTPQQKRSVDYAVRYLDSIGVPLQKIVLGAAFYARSWEGVDGADNGRYQSGKFKSFISYRDFDKHLGTDKGFVFYRDAAARAPYAYSARLKEYATFDDPVSLAEKTRYAAEKGLGGIMFWQLTGDSADGALLKAIYEAAPKR